MTVALYSGSDEAVLRSTVSEAVHELVGDGDRTLIVDEFDGDDYELADVVAAANTPPFLTDFRVVVAREIGRFTADQLGPLLEYLDEPSPTTHLVLVSGSGRQPKKLTDAVKGVKGGAVTNTTPPSRPRDRRDWITARAGERGVELRPDAANRLADHLGEDVGRLDSLLETLVGMFDGTPIDGAAVEPFLGEAGDIPPWDLTDAIDGGNTAKALSLLSRMLGAGRHPLQVMAILQSHYTRLARLDGAGVRNDADAATALGIKAGFPAKKAFQLSQRLGGARVRRALDLLATADLDVRGAREVPDDVVLQILVARLARLS